MVTISYQDVFQAIHYQFVCTMQKTIKLAPKKWIFLESLVPWCRVSAIIQLTPKTRR